MNWQILIMAFIAIASSTIIEAATAVSIPNLGSASSASTQASSCDGSVIKVMGKGIGADKASALKDAFRDAVERAVGLYVDAEQMVKNDSLISDQVLTLSNAYVTKYDIVKESENDGSHSVKILAEVKKSALTKKLMDVMPTQRIEVGASSQNLFAKMSSKDKRDKDGSAIFENFLKDKNPGKQLVRVTLDSTEPKVVKSDANNSIVTLAYLFKAEIDQDRYKNDFLPQFTDILGQLSAEQAKKTRLRKNDSWAINQAARALGKYRSEYEARHSQYTPEGNLGVPFVLSGDLAFGDGRVLNVAYGPNHEICSGLSGLAVATPEYDLLRDINRIEKSKLPIRVLTTVNGSKTSFSAMDYVLDGSMWPVLIKWMDQWLGAEFGKPDKKIKYTVIFKDESGDEVAAFPCDINTRQISNFSVCRTSNWAYYAYITPFVQNAAEAYYVWWKFDFAKDDLAKVKSIEIELAE